MKKIAYEKNVCVDEWKMKRNWTRLGGGGAGDVYLFLWISLSQHLLQTTSLPKFPNPLIGLGDGERPPRTKFFSISYTFF